MRAKKYRNLVRHGLGQEMARGLGKQLRRCLCSERSERNDCGSPVSFFGHNRCHYVYDLYTKRVLAPGSKSGRTTTSGNKNCLYVFWVTFLYLHPTPPKSTQWPGVGWVGRGLGYLSHLWRRHRVEPFPTFLNTPRW